ncbi:MAG: DUF6680 family protein [bacterium]
MSISDWLTIAAIILGPILAVQVQERLNKSKEKRLKKLELFKILMATRANLLSPDHVSALNRIELEFDSDNKNEKLVIENWREYLDHLGSGPGDGDPRDLEFSEKLNRWGDKRVDLLIDLLHSMSKVLGYNFDKVQLKRGIYSPKAHGDFESDQNFIRKSLVELFGFQRALPIVIIEPNQEKVPNDDGNNKKNEEDGKNNK